MELRKVAASTPLPTLVAAQAAVSRSFTGFEVAYSLQAVSLLGAASRISFPTHLLSVVFIHPCSRCCSSHFPSSTSRQHPLLTLLWTNPCVRIIIVLFL